MQIGKSFTLVTPCLSIDSTTDRRCIQRLTKCAHDASNLERTPEVARFWARVLVSLFGNVGRGDLLCALGSALGVVGGSCGTFARQGRSHPHPALLFRLCTGQRRSAGWTKRRWGRCETRLTVWMCTDGRVRCHVVFIGAEVSGTSLTGGGGVLSLLPGGRYM